MKGIVEDPTAEEGESAGFGCPVNNRFGQLLDDDCSDPFDIIRGAQAEKKKKKKDEPKKAALPAPSAKPPVKKESQKDRRAPISGGAEPPQTARVPAQKFPSRGGGRPDEERGERRVGFRDRRADDNEASMGFSIERPAEQGERGPRGRGGARGGGRGGARGVGQFRSTDGFDQRGKREFERHSGSDRTGVRPEEKRGGNGPRNWGSTRDQMSVMAEGAPNEEVAEGEEGADPAEAGANQPPEGEAVEEPAVEMSLDEWKALQQQSKPKAEFNLRKPDTAVPSNSMVIHKSKKQLEEQAEEAEEDEAAAMRRPANDITAKLEINFGSLGRPSRGARGGGRGRGRGGAASRPETTSPQKPPEKPRVQARVPIHDDPEDFPALA